MRKSGFLVVVLLITALLRTGCETGSFEKEDFSPESTMPIDTTINDAITVTEENNIPHETEGIQNGSDETETPTWQEDDDEGQETEDSQTGDDGNIGGEIFD